MPAVPDFGMSALMELVVENLGMWMAQFWPILALLIGLGVVTWGFTIIVSRVRVMAGLDVVVLDEEGNRYAISADEIRGWQSESIKGQMRKGVKKSTRLHLGDSAPGED